MSAKTACVLLRDGYADWEAASAVAELRRSFGYVVHIIGMDSKPITSMGGFKVIPDLPLSEYAPKRAAILILPGGDAWMKEENAEVSNAAIATVAEGSPVAAICAATLALAHAGLLNDRRHTSNGRGFIEKHVSKYHGQHLYEAVPAVTDRLVITANGLAPFLFAAQIFRLLEPQRKQDIDMYEGLYAKGLLD